MGRKYFYILQVNSSANILLLHLSIVWFDSSPRTFNNLLMQIFKVLAILAHMVCIIFQAATKSDNKPQQTSTAVGKNVMWVLL